MTGPYDRAALFSEQREFTFPENPHKVGLCISAGFTNNSWPAVYWLELASLLRARSIEVFLIGGPMEASLLKMLSSFLKLDANRVIQGDRQYRFLEIVRSLDLVIASDSGTAHLCSLAAPMLSIFGPSPFRRFAPFGNHNRVLTYDLKCSPCSQFHPHILNECHSRECLSLILPRHVLEALDHGLGAGPSNASAILKGGPKVFSAVGNIFS
jgi:heptosyltransferase-2